MRLPTRVRLVLGAGALVALIVGVFLWGGPAEFSGAEVGESVECDSGVCQVIHVDDSLWGVTIEDYSDLPRIVLFEGTETEVSEWTSQQHTEATRPGAIGWFVGAVILGAIAVISSSRTTSR